MDKCTSLSFTSCLSAAVVKINGERIDWTLERVHIAL